MGSSVAFCQYFNLTLKKTNSRDKEELPQRLFNCEAMTASSFNRNQNQMLLVTTPNILSESTQEEE